MSKRKDTKAEEAGNRSLILDLEIMLAWAKLTPAEKEDAIRRIKAHPVLGPRWEAMQ